MVTAQIIQTPIVTDKVLLVEDDPEIATMVRLILRDEGFEVLMATGVAEGLDLVRTMNPLVAIVDLRLGGEDGLDLVRALTINTTTSVLIVSGKTETVDRIIGLEVGADDYITKPFDTRELTARVKRHAARVRVLREIARTRPEPRVHLLGRWTIDERALTVADNWSSARVDLSDSEWRLLMTLLRNRGKVMTRDEIAEAMGQARPDPLDRRIDGHVASLRRKLDTRGDRSIRTVHRRGYIIDPAD